MIESFKAIEEILYEKGIRLPKTWQYKGRVPFNLIKESNPKFTIYAIALFERKRPIIFNKQFESIGTTETRYARKLIEEAKELNWISMEWPESTIGPRLPGYPKKAQMTYWTEIKDNS